MAKIKFKIGDRVICINTSDIDYESDVIIPELGKNTQSGPKSGSGLGIHLVEIVNPLRETLLGISEATFHQNRFIKVDDDFEKEVEIENKKKVKNNFVF